MAWFARGLSWAETRPITHDPLKSFIASIITETHALLSKLSGLTLLIIPAFRYQGESGNRHGDNQDI